MEMIKLKFPLNGGSLSNHINIGRDQAPMVSDTRWEDNRLVIHNRIPYYDSKSKNYKESTVIYTLWLEKPLAAPWEPRLIIETKRLPTDGALPVINQTIYSKGYR